MRLPFPQSFIILYPSGPALVHQGQVLLVHSLPDDEVHLLPHGCLNSNMMYTGQNYFLLLQTFLRLSGSLPSCKENLKLEKVSNIVGLTALRLAFFMGYE